MSDLPKETFPGGDVDAREDELRICIEHSAYAEVLSHAKEEADIEVGGVFVGKLKQDKRGPWLHIQHAIRGENAQKAGEHIKFTHDTWNHFYKIKDGKFDKLDFVGWYHTHPSFGIFLSEMDQFIHKSYFDNPNQVAYVYDPHAGTEGFFRKPKDKIVQLDRYWHGGKQRKVVSQEPGSKPVNLNAVGGDMGASIAALNETVRRLELELRERPPGALAAAIPLWVMAFLILGFFIYTAWPRSKDPLILVPWTDKKTQREYYVEWRPGEPDPRDVPRKDEEKK